MKQPTNYRKIKFEVEFTTLGEGISDEFIKNLLYMSGIGKLSITYTVIKKEDSSFLDETIALQKLIKDENWYAAERLALLIVEECNKKQRSH